MIKTYILSILLFIISFAPTRGEGSGSNTVFMKIHHDHFTLVSAVRESAPNPKIFDLLESFKRPIYFANLENDDYDYVNYYTAAGFEVEIVFEGYQRVVFRYYSNLDSIAGMNSKGEILILRR